jgi:hypothetical protein
MRTINNFAKFLAQLKDGNPFRWHFDRGSSFWIARDTPSPLACVKHSESTDLNLVPSSQSTNDAVKYGGHDGVGFLQGRPNGLVNLFCQIGSCHLARSRGITKSITMLLVLLTPSAVRAMTPAVSVTSHGPKRRKHECGN